MIGLPLSKFNFGVKRALASQTPAALLFGDYFRAHQMFFPLCQFFDLLPLPLIVVLVHFVVRLVPEGLEGHKLA